MAKLQHLLARAGVRLGAIYVCGRCRTADDVACLFGLRPLGEAWREVDSRRAATILRSILKRDLAYHVAADTAQDAAEIAGEFVRQFSEGARYFTNGDWPDDNPTCDGRIGIWTPATESTFDAGILVLHEHRVGVFWIEDED
jgi:hypothetical protein